MHPELKSLLETYPLSARWSTPELFLEEVEIEKMRLYSAGIVSQDRGGVSVTGSAANRSEYSVARCYFELLERTSIIEAEMKGTGERFLRDISGTIKESALESSVFPKSPAPERWTYSRSNGVAAHTKWHLACRSAAEELIERDHILRSWFGEIRPERVPSEIAPLHPELAQNYVFECYRFAEPSPKMRGGLALMTSVVGVFGFPRRLEIPLIYGFAARSTEAESVQAADRECLQRLSFLWGESLPGTAPQFSPTPDFHQDVFLGPEGLSRLRGWLKGNHLYFHDPKKLKVRPSPEILFVDLTPEHLRDRFHIVKAHSRAYLPLTFGYREDIFPVGFPTELLIHPVA